MKKLKTLISASLITVLASCSLLESASEKRLQQALVGEHRSAENKARDIYRNPKETLTFFGFQPSMTVVEVSPGGGWYTEVLAPALKGVGVYYAAAYPDTGKKDYYSRSRKTFLEKLASDPVYSEVKVTDFTPRKQSQIAPVGSADLVLTFRNLHNWKEDGVLQMFKDANQALKSGGILGVVEHRMPTNKEYTAKDRSGYFPEALTIELARKAGFILAAKSDVNANPKDTADHPKGVWTLPPVLRLKEQDKAKYLAIGESDRMTLKFIKP